MKVLEKLKSLEKLFRRIAFFNFGLIWIELIIMIIPKYNSVGEVLYDNFGTNGLTFYLSIFIIISIFFLWASKQISLVENDYLNERKKEPNNL
jgi:succinate-acetate transporter protein